METKYSKFLTILLIIIIVGVIGLLGYLAYDFFKNNNIEQEAAEYVQSFTNPNEENSTQPDSSTEQNNVGGVSNDIDIGELEISGGSSNKKKTYKGHNVIGTIEIPKTNVSYPVLEKPTRKALEISVASLYPRDAVLNTKGNVVIIGHNYRNGKFFSNNKKLSNGDKIYITDGAREITLSTCTDDSSARTIILAKAQGD